MDMSTFLMILKTIFVLVAVIFLANFLLKLLNNEMKKNNKIIRVIERVQLNTSSSLSIVEVCGEYFLMSTTDKENSILRELDKEEIEKIISMKEYNNENDSVNIKSFIETLKRGKES